MKKSQLLFFLFLITAFSAPAQLLYKCESPAGDTITWVMGTIHYTDRNGFREDPVFDSLISNADVFFEEPLLPEHLSPEQKMRLTHAQRYDSGKTLKNFLSKKEQARLTRHLSAELEVTPSVIRSFFVYTPFFMLSKLPPKDSIRHLEMDNYLIDKAKFYKRRIVPLDHPDSILQIGLVLSQKYQPEWLLKVYQTYYKNVAAVEKAYRSQDTSKVLKYIGDPADPQYTLLIARRNEQWVKIIGKESGKRNFIEAGLAHVIAPFDGLVDYFRRKNWKVSAVKVNLFTEGQ
ncbi:TraB/GumN family protein [Nostoc ellipsosporum NOK]|nr:TraB/GumN family protein [Nostoc ellipsosporum NOK]